MRKEELVRIRHILGRTQEEMARLLGISLKAVQSYEQGWRKVPMHIARQSLFLLHTTKSPEIRYKPCWDVEKCPMETRQHCPAWELQLGHLCWFINGTICQGQVQDDWHTKLQICRSCKVFKTLMPHLPQTEDQDDVESLY